MAEAETNPRWLAMLMTAIPVALAAATMLLVPPRSCSMQPDKTDAEIVRSSH